MRDILRPGVRVVITGTIAAWDRDEQEHYYASAGNQFWRLLFESGLVPVQLRPEDDHQLPDYGVGLTDLVRTEHRVPGEPPVFDVASFLEAVRVAAPLAIAFVSKTSASSYARAVGERLPKMFGPLPWDVAGIPAFVLPGPSGANNGMPLPVRIAMWADLVDFLETLTM